jgi:hypothetical protein
VGGSPTGTQLLPTGQYTTALAALGSSFQRLATGRRADGTADAAGALTTALSPDGTRLLVLTSGYNANFDTTSGARITAFYLDPTTVKPSPKYTSAAFNWVFIFDVAHGGAPRKLQQIQLPDTFAGIAWDPECPVASAELRRRHRIDDTGR